MSPTPQNKVRTRPHNRHSMAALGRSFYGSSAEGKEEFDGMEKRLLRLEAMQVIAREPYEDCPRFEKLCSVNRCPLSSRYALLECLEPEVDGEGKEIPFTGDSERKCLARRSTREEIAARYPGVLPTGGVLDAEIARDKRREARRRVWESLPEEERAKRSGKLRELSAKRVSERASEHPSA